VERAPVRFPIAAARDGIDWFDDERSNPLPLFAPLRQSAPAPTFDDDQGDTRSQFVERLFGCGGASDSKEFVLIRQEYIDLIDQRIKKATQTPAWSSLVSSETFNPADLRPSKN